VRTAQRRPETLNLKIKNSESQFLSYDDDDDDDGGFGYEGNDLAVSATINNYSQS
jgi:hypothetical protein